MPGPKTNEREGTRAMVRGAPISAYKVREVLDLIRDRPVEDAADILRFCERGAAETVAKVLASAVANAGHNDQLGQPEELFVSACFADEGKTQRRMRPRARGRATRIRKRSCHITIIVSRMPEEQLRRVRARQEAEQANRRARRAASRAGDAARPTRRGAAAPAAHDHDHEHELDESVTEESVTEEAEDAEGATGVVTDDAAVATESAEVESAGVEVAEAEAAEPVEAVEAETEAASEKPKEEGR